MKPSISVHHTAVSTCVHLVISRTIREYTNLSWRNKPTAVRKGQVWGIGIIWWTEHMTSSWMVLERMLLFCLTRLGMNGLQAPVFTQYIRSKWKVCAAAKSREWWLCITFRGEDALQQALAPRVVWMRRVLCAFQDIWCARPTQRSPYKQLSRLGDALHASDIWDI